MYLTYAEYQEYGGTLDETAFNDIEFEAESYVNWYTFDRLCDEDEIPERVKKCMYQIIKLIQKQLELMNTPITNSEDESESSAQVASEANDGVSVAYNVISANEALELAKKDVENSIKRYLQGVTNSLGRKLLYRGIYPDE